MNRPKTTQKILRGIVQLLGMVNVPAGNLSADAVRARQWVDQMSHWFTVRVPKRSKSVKKKSRARGIFKRRKHGLGRR